jgi:acyl transferase domain-containing protein/aryl carrier-like protein
MEKGFVSSLTGQVGRSEDLSAGSYWGRQAREAVQFRRAMERLAAQGCTAYVEMGPGTTLLGLGQQCVGAGEAVWVASLRRQRGEWQQVLESAGQLWARGVAVDWKSFDQPYARRRLPLPTSPFARHRFWVDTRKTAQASSALHPLLTSHVSLAEPQGLQVFEGTLSLELQPFIADHVIQDKVIVPATAYLEMAGAAARILGIQAPLIEKIEYQQPLHLEPGAARTVQVMLDGRPRPATAFRVFSRPQQSHEDWTLHAVGHINASARGDATREMNREAFERVRSVGCEITGEEFYCDFRKLGNAWGPAFQALDRVWIDGNEAWAKVNIPQAIRGDIESYLFHPALADACGHALAALLNFRAHSSAFMGAAIDGIRTYQSPAGGELYAYACLREGSGGVREVIGDVDLFDRYGRLVSELRGAHLWLLSSEQSDHAPRNWFYSLLWMADQSRPPVAADDLLNDRYWFVLADQSGVGQAVASKLREHKAETLILIPGDTYHRLAADEIQIRAGSEEDLRAVLALAPQSTAIGIIHAWACDTAPLDSASVTDMHTATDLGCSTVLGLVRALQATHKATPSRLWVVTRGAQAVGGEEAISVLQSPLWGYCRSLAAEHSELWGGMIDLDPAASFDVAAEEIIAELSLGGGEDQIAYRQGRRHVSRLDRCAPVSNGAVKTAICTDAAYWVTGGLGGLGLGIAKWLADAGARHIALLGRTTLPHRDGWDSCPDPIAKERIRAVREIEAAGARVYVYSADIADEPRLRHILTEMTAQGAPRVRGVFHAAGIMQHKAILETGADDLAAVSRAKVLGSVALHRVLRDEPLELCIYFSSASAVLYSPFLSTYAAANAFLDALAHHRRLGGQQAVSVNWGMWGDAGMATAFSSELTSRLAERGMGIISLKQGLDALDVLLREAPPQVAVLPVDWDKWRVHAPGYANAPIFSRLQVPREPSRVATMARRDLVADLRRASGHERHVLLRRFVTEMVSDVIGFAAETLNVDDPLTSMGLDSLMALELKNRFEKDLAVSVSVVSLLEGPSIQELSLRVEHQLQGPPESVSASVASTVLPQKPVDDMSDEEVDAMLAELIAEQGEVVDATEQ